MILRLLFRRLMLIHPLAVAIALTLAAGDASAQMEFAGIAYGTPPQATADRLREMGYRLRGVDQEGDWVFEAPDGAELVALMDTAGLHQVQQAWMRPPGSDAAHFHRLRDSLRSLLGEPTSQEDNYVLWRQENLKLELSVFPPEARQGPLVALRHTGPGAYEESMRRYYLLEAARERDGADAAGGWDSVGGRNHWMLWVDTAGAVQTAPGVFRVRLRQSADSNLRLDDGRKYSEIIVYAEMDCNTSRLRRQRALLAYSGVPLSGAQAPGGPEGWYRPGPETVEAFLFPDGCTAVTRYLANRNSR